MACCYLSRIFFSLIISDIFFVMSEMKIAMEGSPAYYYLITFILKNLLSRTERDVSESLRLFSLAIEELSKLASFYLMR